MEVSFVGSQFTWKKANRRMWQRLDRLFCNAEWMNKFSDVKCVHLNRNNSDHSPLVGQFQVESSFKGCFKFQGMWVKHHSFLETVQNNWAIVGNPVYIFPSKLSRLKKCLITWNKEQFGHLSVNIAKAEADLCDAEIRLQVDDSDEALAAAESAKHKLNHMLDLEESFWRQRSKAKWLKDGDKNTKFFHSIVDHRRKKSRIHKIQDGNGNWLTKQEDMIAAGVNFFKNQFSSTYEERDFELVSQLIPAVISDSMNTELTKMPSAEEIHPMLLAMDPDSFAGPDGFNGVFYKHCWVIIQADLVAAIQSSFLLGSAFPSLGQVHFLLQFLKWLVLRILVI